MKSRFFASVALGFAALGLAACGSGEEAPAETAPEAPAGIEVSNGRLMLPPVSGNPGAVYFDVANSGDRDMVIRSAAVAGAESAEIHSTGTWDGEPAMHEVFQLAVPAGETVAFEPGGLHVMAMDLGEGVSAGSTAEVTLTFAGGDKVSFPAEVRAAGDER